MEFMEFHVVLLIPLKQKTALQMNLMQFTTSIHKAAFIKTSRQLRDIVKVCIP